MIEAVLILFAAGLIYYVATRVAPHGLMFKIKKEEAAIQNKEKDQKKQVELEEDKEEDVLIREGQDLLNKDQLEAAEKKFLSAIKIDPVSARAYHFLGMIYLRQKIYKGAIATLEKAVKIDPLNDVAFNNLGSAYLGVENYEKAAESFEKSVSLNDKIAHRYLNLGIAYNHLKNHDKAAIALENAAKIYPTGENLSLLAKCYIAMDDKKLSKKTIERLLEVDPKNPWAKRHLATFED